MIGGYRNGCKLGDLFMFSLIMLAIYYCAYLHEGITVSIFICNSALLNLITASISVKSLISHLCLCLVVSKILQFKHHTFCVQLCHT